MERINETIDASIVIDSADITTAVTSPYTSMANYRNVYAKAKSGTVADTKIMTLTLLQAEDDSGTNAKELGTAVTVTSVGGEELTAEIEALSNEMDTNGDFAYVAVKIESDNASAVTGAVALVFGNKRDR